MGDELLTFKDLAYGLLKIVIHQSEQMSKDIITPPFREIALDALQENALYKTFENVIAYIKTK